MKTTSSKLYRGVMLIAALVVPATTWWVSLRQYNARRQEQSALAAEKKVQQQYEGSKSSRAAPPMRLDSGSVEFAPTQVLRTSWNGQTDPDSVWHDQRLRANTMLRDHGLPALDVPRPLPDSPAAPKALRIGGQK